MVESQSFIEMKVGKGSGEDLVEKKEKNLDPSSNLLNVKISRSLKSFERRNDNISLKKERIKDINSRSFLMVYL